MKTKDNIQYAPCTDCGDNYKNPDYYSLVIVRNITERNNLPCKLRQNGMIAVVIEENFKHYQIQTTPEIGACNNTSWVAIDSGGSSLSGENLLIFNSRDAAQSYILSSVARDGQMLYVIEEVNYFKLENGELVDPFPNKLDTITNIISDTTGTTRLVIENSKTGVYSKVKAPFNIEGNKLRIPSDNTFEVDGPILLNGSSYQYNTATKFLYLGGGTLPSVMRSPSVNGGVLAGDNIFPVLEGRIEVGQSYNANYNYLGLGRNIFTSLKGNTDYRPEHPAHDSWVGVGHDLGKGVEDGTNITLVGTANFHRNDVKYWDSITAVGKGLTNGVPIPGQSLNPDRVVNPISTPSYNMRSLMSGVTMIGSEHWFMDTHALVTIGSSIKPFRYGYNSIAIGNQIQDFSAVKYPGESFDMFLDNDIIIGNGLYKDPKKYPQTHNFIVGSNTHYGVGGGWDKDYVPLLEGNFKKEYLNINGELGLRTKDVHETAEHVEVPLNVVSNTGSFVDVGGGIYASNNAQSGSITLEGLKPNTKYLVKYKPLSPIVVGYYGVDTNGFLDFDNFNIGMYSNAKIISESATSPKIIIHGNNLIGSIKITVWEILPQSPSKPLVTIKDSTQQTSLEMRFTNSTDNSIFIGNHSGEGHLITKNNVAIGSNTLRYNTQSAGNTVVGQYAMSEGSRGRNSTAVGFNALKNVDDAGNNNAYGANSLLKLSSGNGNSAFGNLSGSDITVGTYNALFGERAGAVSASLNRVTAIGAFAGALKNNLQGGVYLGYRAMAFTDSNIEEIVISANSTEELLYGKGSYTTTIGNDRTLMTYLYGEVTTNRGFKIEGKTNNDFVLAGGGSKSIYETLRDGLTQMTQAERAEILRILNT